MRFKDRTLTAVQILAMALWLATSAFAQVAQTPLNPRAKRTVLVSVLDRRLAVLEDGDVIATFPVAVGADAAPVLRVNFKLSAAFPIPLTTSRAP